MRRCHQILTLSTKMYFGDNFANAALEEVKHMEEVGLTDKAQGSWFVQATQKCTLFQINKDKLDHLMPHALQVSIHNNALLLHEQIRVAITHYRAGLGPPVAAPGHLFSTSYGPPF